MPTDPPRSASRRPRLLVVDDTADMRRSIRRILSKSPLDIVEAVDGKMAVELVSEGIRKGEPFDAILIDVEMPRMNGKDALEAIARVAPELADRAVVMSGGAWESELGQWLAALPAHRVLAKPMSVEALREAVQRALAS